MTKRERKYHKAKKSKKSISKIRKSFRDARFKNTVFQPLGGSWSRILDIIREEIIK